jgi:hypothetical protein
MLQASCGGWGGHDSRAAAGAAASCSAAADDSRGLALVVSTRCWHRIMCLCCWERFRLFVKDGGGLCPRCGVVVGMYAFAPLRPEEQALVGAGEAGQQQK